MFGKKDVTKNRFVVVYNEDGISGCKILVDKETGVNYLYSRDGYSGGLTPLLNKDGAPIITKISEEF